MAARQLHAAPHGEACQAFLAMTAWWGGWLPVRLGSWAYQDFAWRCPTSSRARWRDLAGLVADLENEHDDDVLLGMPQTRPNVGGVGKVSVLWARVTGKEQLAWARKFRPLPTFVLQEGGGSSRVLFWWLERTIPWADAVALNRRLAYKFGAVQKFSDPDLLWINAPGTSMRDGRARPAPVRVARLTTASFQPAVFERHRGLKEPPARDWMTARA
jgi:hypothetical protein